MSTWPSVGFTVCPTRPGCTNAKFETAKRTMTAVPFPITWSFAGDGSDNAGPAAGVSTAAQTGKLLRTGGSGQADAHEAYGVPPARLGPPDHYEGEGDGKGGA